MSTSQEYMPVNPSVISWARDRAGYSLDEAELIFKKITLWENGSAFPTYPQLEQISERFKVPIAVFFFPEAPDVPPIEETFRTLTKDDINRIPQKVRMLLRKAQAMQLNLAELHDDVKFDKPLITRDISLSFNRSIEVAVEELRDYLGVSMEEQYTWASVEDALENWRRALSEKGVYVFKDAFREPNYYGFCLYDESFPVIYINNSCAKSRQIFTIFHELAHLLFHTSGIDIINDDYINNLPKDSQRIEIICNRFASKFLVPEAALNKELIGREINRDVASEIASKFCVSREVIYRKLLDRDLISSHEYTQAVNQWNDAMKRERSSGGDFYYNQMAYLGRGYVSLAFEKFYQNKFSSSQLAEYLNIKPKNLAGLEDRFLRALA